MPFFKSVYKKETDPEQVDSLYRYCSAFQPSLAWGKIRPVVDDAERTYIKRVIGPEFYQELDDAYQADSMTTQQETFVRLLQPAIAHFTYSEALVTLATSVGDMGPGEAMDKKDGTFVFPRQWVSVNSRLQHFRKGNQRLEEALQFLELNSSDYNTWVQSDAFTFSKELFFNSATELEVYLPSNQCSRAVYLVLRNSIKEAERVYIRKTIGVELFDELKEAILAENLTDKQKELLEYIRWALVKWMQKLAIPGMRLQFNDTGLVEPSFDDGVTKKNRQAVGSNVVRSLWVNLDEAAQLFLADLKSYLDKNADLFPTYKASDAYEDGEGSHGFLDQEDEDGCDYSVIVL